MHRDVALPIPLICTHAVTVARIYERSGYDYFIDYRSDPLPSLSESALDWIDALLKQQGLR